MRLTPQARLRRPGTCPGKKYTRSGGNKESIRTRRPAGGRSPLGLECRRRREIKSARPPRVSEEAYVSPRCTKGPAQPAERKTPAHLFRLRFALLPDRSRPTRGLSHRSMWRRESFADSDWTGWLTAMIAIFAERRLKPYIAGCQMLLVCHGIFIFSLLKCGWLWG